MLRRRGRVAIAVLAAVLLLFAGRWTSSFLADRWWAAQFSPSAAAFVSGIRILQLALDATGVLIASAWFIGNFAFVSRAIGSVQVPRQVGNLDFREAVTPSLLRLCVVAGGAALGLLVGLDASAYWPAVALAWHGVTYGLVEPLLGHDAGYYVARLPLWRILHTFALLLALLALAASITLYAVIGAVRVIGGRLGINDHARAHIGWLLAALAVCLGWGYLLEPYEAVALGNGAPLRQAFDLVTLVAPALAGTALMVAVLSALWALRPRHALIAAGWVVLLIASVARHRVLPLLAGGNDSSSVTTIVSRRFNEAAFGLDSIGSVRFGGAAVAAPRIIALWDAGSAAAAVTQEGRGVVSADPALLGAGPEPFPAWLVTRTDESGTGVVALAADRVSSAGAPLYYRAGDSLAYPTPYLFLDVSPDAVHPGAPAYRVGASSHGIIAGGSLRRAALAWALQAPELLGTLPAGARVSWGLQPSDRLSRLASFADWSSSGAAIVDGRLMWISDGYVSSESFPLVEPLQWRNGVSTTVRAAFVGTVDAETGAAHVYLRPRGGPLALAWAGIASAVVEDSGAIPAAVSSALRYPAELFRLQSTALARAPWNFGTLAARAGGPQPDPALPQAAWRQDGRGTSLIAAYEKRTRRVESLLVGSVEGGRDRLRLFRLDSVATLPAPAALTTRWARFPTYVQLRDSIMAAGSRLDTRPVSFWIGDDGIGASQAGLAIRAGARPVVAWVALAAGERLGGGRGTSAAWDNLRGTSGPLPPGAGGGTLDEAQRWLRLADAALRRGDWVAFGRSFDALRQVLDVRADSGSK